jgi:hypothetical protein
LLLSNSLSLSSLLEKEDSLGITARVEDISSYSLGIIIALTPEREAKFSKYLSLFQASSWRNITFV